MYWEVYGGQSIDGFTHIGTEDYLVPIEDVEEQIPEIKRVCGEDALICVFREDHQ